MASAPDANDSEEIRRLVKTINEAWLRGRPEELAAYFHADMVIVPPGFSGRAEGRGACVQGYKDFVIQAKVREYKDAEPSIDLWGDTAVATYSWEIAYEMNGQDFREAGWDVFVFLRENAKWQAVWRTIWLSPPNS